MSLESFQTFQHQLSAILETLLATAFRDITQLVKYSLLHDIVHSREEAQVLTERLQGAGGQRRGKSECREAGEEKKDVLFVVKQDPEASGEGEKVISPMLNEEDYGLELGASLLRNCRAVEHLSTIGVNSEAEMDKRDQPFHGESAPAQSSETFTVRQNCQWTCNLLTGNYRNETERATQPSPRASDQLQRWDVQSACIASVCLNKEEDTEGVGNRQGNALPFVVDIADRTCKAQGQLGQTPPNNRDTRTSERGSEFPNTLTREVALTMRGISPRLSSLPYTTNPPTTPRVTPNTTRGKSVLQLSPGFITPNSMRAKESIPHKINRGYIGKGHSSMGHTSEVTFSQKGHVAGPVNAGEVKKKFHECSHCGKTFLLKRNLLYHQRYHMAERTHTCTECGKGFVYRCHLKAHMRSHSGERAYNCTECGKSFIYLWNLKKHMTIHLGLRPYCCSTCNKTFIWKSDLKKHKQIHTKKTI
ncbi:zinc finger protein with KRAB and SCAN domains 1-like isoform X3 [Electrophorus electricus]|uniref:zinc finger protein with KRAB and SCAN domains 1-like isoform X3 n=1 Tax=Electrophorus electricus TaxID=8005 RepID=UPI0015CFEF49|nr:zinc finger protein with KRAB and SCAN domains 1-like isoform X3 [Electrophorus electricus]